MPTDQHSPERRMIHEPGKTPGSAEGEDPLHRAKPDVGRTPGSAEGELMEEPEQKQERTRR